MMRHESLKAIICRWTAIKTSKWKPLNDFLLTLAHIWQPTDINIHLSEKKHEYLHVSHYGCQEFPVENNANEDFRVSVWLLMCATWSGCRCESTGCDIFAPNLNSPIAGCQNSLIVLSEISMKAGLWSLPIKAHHTKVNHWVHQALFHAPPPTPIWIPLEADEHFGSVNTISTALPSQLYYPLT